MYFDPNENAGKIQQVEESRRSKISTCISLVFSVQCNRQHSSTKIKMG